MAPNPKRATRPSIPDQLENASHELDLLIRDARVSPDQRHDRRHADLEERAQAIAASIVASFRGEVTRSAPPLRMEVQGAKSSAWF
ncbi:hypothetical protein FHS51_001401 [Sphingobium wenxiniae]|uniref:Uncharacterized protein n=1 Tax=Sphingobium wenxiniae (strain DSM 21828 / CGMCC 1.7748 / JZ-1) TaxID=595605 RepID=A0A562KKW1_SPHWJ|nr:hypothetical protein [Sphingobium wenxiniae]MBB6191179.1 hypothetical protein [Sphingobium wenxiniae]TWH96021.1 hypothetical protein IQ35_01110 [Sphingobium wenxiniae]